MESQVWLIDLKATLGEFSPLNLDGSSWILGVCVLAARGHDDALGKLTEFLKTKEMALIEIYDSREFNSVDHEDRSRRSNQIINAVRMVRNDGKTCFVFARTSEAMAEGTNDE